MSWLKNILLKIAQTFSDLLQTIFQKSSTGPEMPKITSPDIADEPAWLRRARSYLGERENPGFIDNKFILRCFDFTTYPKTNIHDEVPWCAAFVCRCLAETGQKHTGSAAANSYVHYGKTSELVPGAIIVFKWADGSFHVTFFVSVSKLNEGFVVALGGNQSNAVNLASYSMKYIHSIRYPA